MAVADRDGRRDTPLRAVAISSRTRIPASIWLATTSGAATGPADGVPAWCYL